MLTVSQLNPAAPATGLYFDVPQAVYFDIRAVNASALKAAHSASLAHAKYMLDGGERPGTRSMQLGSAVDCRTFQPEQYAERFRVKPTFAGKGAKEREAEWLDSIGTAEAITEAVDAEAGEISDAIRRNPLARRLIDAPGYSQAVAVWIDADTGLTCKAAFDRYDCGRLGVELKTTESAHPRRFGSKAATYGYHQQLAHYIDGFIAVTGKPTPIALIVAETSQPYPVVVYSLSRADLDAGRAINRKVMRDIAKASESGVWPGYSDAKVLTLELPDWARTDGAIAGSYDIPEDDTGPL